MASESLYQVVGYYEADGTADGLEKAKQEVLNHVKIARQQPGCKCSRVSEDLETQRLTVYEEWKGKNEFLMYLQETDQLGPNFTITYYEASPFRGPDMQPRPDYQWGRAERKQLTKQGPQLFFLSIENRTQHALFNHTPDLQFDVSMRFPKQDMRPCDGVALSGEHFKLTVFPGQTTPFVTGKWNGGYALSYSYGPVTDPKFLDESAKELDLKVKRGVQQWKDFLIDNGINPDEPGLLADDESKKRFEEEAVALCTRSQRSGVVPPEYVDLTWLPSQTSICRPQEGKVPVRAWMRPHDYLPAEYKDRFDLMVKERGDDVGATPDDIDQGALGDCWFMAAIAACAEMPRELIEPMFTDLSQAKANHRDYMDWHTLEKKCGFFKIRLAKHGWWRWHVVDTFLPVQPIKCPGGPCFAKNRQQPHEMWVAMLEKVYAKCHGSYQAIAGGDPAVALSDLTGFPTVTFDWPDQMKGSYEEDKDTLFEKILQHDSRDRMLWVTTPGEDTTDYSGDGGGGHSGATRSRAAKYDDVGLVTGHAYTILKAIKVEGRRSGKTHRLLQIRNPWGGEKEWTKAWADYDPQKQQGMEWVQHPEVAEAIAERWTNDYPSGHGVPSAGPGTVLEKKADGSYWMSWDDSLSYFDGGGVCLRQQGWQDVRFRTGFSDGQPDHFFRISPSSSCRAIAFAVQHDRRGLMKDDKRIDPCALRIEVLTQGPKKPMYDTVAQSNEGVFMYANQAVAFNCNFPGAEAGAHEKEEPFELEAGKEYYLIVRQHPNEAKQHVRNRDGIVVAIQTSDGNRTGPGSKEEPIKGIKAYTMTPKVKEACRYVGYYGLTHEGAKEAMDIPCQRTYLGATQTDFKADELWTSGM